MAIARKTPRAERRDNGGCGDGRGSTKRGRSAARAEEPAAGKRKRSGNGRGAKRPDRKPARNKPAGCRRLPADPEEWLSLDSEVLLAHYLRSHRDDVRDALVERHLPDVVETARCLAARLPKSVDIDDLCNAGYSGLLRSLETFDPSKGRSFQSYLRTRVHGSMVDELRAMDWLPRLMRSRLARRDRAVEDLRQDLRRDPTEEETAAALGVSLATYRRSYPSIAPTLASGLLSGTEQELDRLGANVVGLGVRGKEARDEAHPLTSLYHQELIERIHELLNETEWVLLELHYFEGFNLREVAQRLELSPARICQIHGRVLQRLKERLREEAPTI